DQNACTTESCNARVCSNGTIPGCTPCTTSADCDDQDACTQDLCTAGACAHTPLANCPAPLVEICGNCIDDDGNGLTDFEDPACCPQARTFQATIRKLRIGARGTGTSKLRLHETVASGLGDANPLVEDVFVQIRPANGFEALCAKVPANRFMRM